MRRETGGGEDADDPRTQEDRDRLHQLQRHRQTRVAKVIVLLVVLVILLLFVLGNSQKVKVKFVFTDSQTPLIIVMLVCAVLGGIIGFIVGRPGRAFRFRRDDEEQK
ncbi:MAG TPA: LapA family protein [Actinomycetota bacterium]